MKYGVVWQPEATTAVAVGCSTSANASTPGWNGSSGPEATDWALLAGLYGELAAIAPSPIVELNRAVAVSMADGPGAALDLVDHIRPEHALDGHHLLRSVRGDLLDRPGRHAEAEAEFERGAAAPGMRWSGRS